MLNILTIIPQLITAVISSTIETATEAVTNSNISSVTIEELISDLALILILGATVTLLFKKLKQPVVLGYIVAGFIASPHFAFFPTINNADNIEFWAQIGIIVLLFSLGLEFSFKKLINVGGSAVVTAITIVVGMMCAGILVGQALHFTFIDSLFLGGMLSMSSTTIIIKAFSDLGLRKKKFTNLVFAVLIVEDLFAVIMMVMLSSIAINKQVEGKELLSSIAKLMFFLIIWFTIGVFAIPTLLKKMRKYLNNETLLVVSMGLCLGMVVLATYAGFSAALGAFVMGSILAGTIDAERIEKVVQPVKDLFGAIFFISVGMMVDPNAIAEYSTTILTLSVVVIVGMICFGTSGMLISGQPLKIAMESGFSLTQIGEFAFIIASLGLSLDVIDADLYPIVVAVSVLTTFTTPYFIRMAEPAYKIMERIIPAKSRILIERYSDKAAVSNAPKASWFILFKKYTWTIMLYSVIIIGIMAASTIFLMPWMKELFPNNGVFYCVIATLMFTTPFLWAICVPNLNNKHLRTLRENNKASNVSIVVMVLARIFFGMVIVVSYLSYFYARHVGLIIGITLFVFFIVLLSRRVGKHYYKLETQFIDNLNSRELYKTGKNNNLVSDMHLAHMTIGNKCPFLGRRLMDSDLRKNYGVNIVSIQRGNTYIAIPKGENRTFPGDIIGVIGNDEQIAKLLAVVENEDTDDTMNTDKHVEFMNITLHEDSPLIGKTTASSRMRDEYSCLVVSIQKQNGTFLQPNGDIEFCEGDILWLAGNPDTIKQLQ